MMIYTHNQIIGQEMATTFIKEIKDPQQNMRMYKKLSQQAKKLSDFHLKSNVISNKFWCLPTSLLWAPSLTNVPLTIVITTRCLSPITQFPTCLMILS
jgi:hypothetical protein